MGQSSTATRSVCPSDSRSIWPGNPSVTGDWHTNPRTGEPMDFITFARTDGRFSKQFDREGNPSEAMLAAQQDRLRNWRMLQGLAGVERKGNGD